MSSILFNFRIGVHHYARPGIKNVKAISLIESDSLKLLSAYSKFVAAKSFVILDSCSCTSSGYFIMKIYSKILTRFNSKSSYNKPDKSEYFDAATFEYFFVTTA